jgi:hypothetical protein
LFLGTPCQFRCRLHRSTGKGVLGSVRPFSSRSLPIGVETFGIGRHFYRQNICQPPATFHVHSNPRGEHRNLHGDVICAAGDWWILSVKMAASNRTGVDQNVDGDAIYIIYRPKIGYQKKIVETVKISFGKRPFSKSRELRCSIHIHCFFDARGTSISWYRLVPTQ